MLYLLPMVKLFCMVTKEKDKKMWEKNKNEVKKIEEKMREEEGLRYFPYMW